MIPDMLDIKIMSFYIVIIGVGAGAGAGAGG
jgi:hypothetical protein